MIFLQQSFMFKDLLMYQGSLVIWKISKVIEVITSNIKIVFCWWNNCRFYFQYEFYFSLLTNLCGQKDTSAFVRKYLRQEISD